MLSPKNHIRGKCMHDATETSVNWAAVQPCRGTTKQKAGARPAFSVLLVESEDQYFAMTGPPKR
jgi:hypothetical protein